MNSEFSSVLAAQLVRLQALPCQPSFPQESSWGWLGGVEVSLGLKPGCPGNGGCGACPHPVPVGWEALSALLFCREGLALFLLIPWEGPRLGGSQLQEEGDSKGTLWDTPSCTSCVVGAGWGQGSEGGFAPALFLPGVCTGIRDCEGGLEQGESREFIPGAAPWPPQQRESEEQQCQCIRNGINFLCEGKELFLSRL